MPFFGSIVVIRRSGQDGSIFPLVSSDCMLGRAEGCDIRVQLPTVSGEHCRISVNHSEQVRNFRFAVYKTFFIFSLFPFSGPPNVFIRRLGPDPNKQKARWIRSNLSPQTRRCFHHRRSKFPLGISR